MDIVVNQIVAVLQVLTFRDTVCSDEYIDVFNNPRLGTILFIKDVTFVFGDGREEGEYIIKCTLKLRNGAFALCTTRNKGSVQSAVCLDSFGKFLRDSLPYRQRL